MERERVVLVGVQHCVCVVFRVPLVPPLTLKLSLSQFIVYRSQPFFNLVRRSLLFACGERQ